MKKLVFCLFAAGLILFNLQIINAQTPGTPDLDGGSGSDGLCCQIDEEKVCWHPNGQQYLRAKWKGGVSFCP